MKNNYQSFMNLPNELKKSVRSIASDDVEEWLRTPIPALKDLFARIKPPPVTICRTSIKRLLVFGLNKTTKHLEILQIFHN